MERVHIYDACLYWVQYKFSVMTDNERKELTEKVEVLKLNGVKPTDSHIDCIGCGS